MPEEPNESQCDVYFITPAHSFTLNTLMFLSASQGSPGLSLYPLCERLLSCSQFGNDFTS